MWNRSGDLQVFHYSKGTFGPLALELQSGSGAGFPAPIQTKCHPMEKVSWRLLQVLADHPATLKRLSIYR